MADASKTHNKGQLVGNQNAGIEAIMGLLSGMAYGLVNPLVGHPFNLVQTRMQADAAYKGMIVPSKCKPLLALSPAVDPSMQAWHASGTYAGYLRKERSLIGSCGTL